MVNLANADHGHQAAGRAGFFAIAEEKIAAAGSAQITHDDVLGVQASVEKLRMIGFVQIEENILGRRLMAGRLHVEPLQGIGFVAGPQFIEPIRSVWELRPELGSNFRAYFVAAATDGRADGGKQVRGLGAELHVHLAYGFGYDALQRAAPTGMDGGHGAILGINEKNRNAVRGLDREEQARTIGSGGVAAARCSGRSIKELNDVRMNLAESAERQAFRAEGGLQAATIFENVFPNVPFRETKIQNLLSAKITHAAGPRAESVNQPGNLGQRGCLENPQAAGLVFGPVLGGRGAPGLFAAEAVARFHSVRRHCGSTSIIGARRTGLNRVGLGRTRAAGGLLIIGMGVDIAEVGRIRKAIERYGETFLRRLYTQKEREYCEQFKNKYERYAGRFAAKEAGMKALGTGWRRGVRWVDLEVVREKSGRPTLKLAGEAEKIAKQLGVKHIAMSITHTEDQALAQVIFEG